MPILALRIIGETKKAFAKVQDEIKGHRVNASKFELTL